MKHTPLIGKKAPELQVSEWLQGNPENLDHLLGDVILIEVFQVNCPGCFLYSLPQAVDLHQRYSNKGLTVLGIATAFEDFELNNQDNLKLLLEQHIVVGETKRVLAENNRLIDGLLPYHIPFSVAIDKINKLADGASENDVSRFIKQYVPDFIQRKEAEKIQIKANAKNYLNAQLYTAETFTLYQLQGTPSHIVIDKKGILKASEFGNFTDLEWLITNLLTE